MLALRPFNLADAFFSISGGRHTPSELEGICRDRGLLSFSVTEGETLRGLAVAESSPRRLHVLFLDGSNDACDLLVKDLVRRAGERAVSVACPPNRTDLRQLLAECAFELLFEGALREGLCLYGRDRGGDANEE